MPIPHKHAVVIKAWADGAKIQWRQPLSLDHWFDTDDPRWNTDIEYRVKPATIKFRNYLARRKASDHTYIAVADTRTMSASFEQQERVNFIKWLGDWQEVEETE